MKATFRCLVISIAIISLSTGAAMACSFPLLNPPPYTQFESWDPGPRVVTFFIDD
jgi:hypothetical protein